MRCEFCPSEVERPRAAAGLRSCRTCGDVAARLDIASKQSQVAPLYNKGNYGFVGGANFKQNALDAGRKTSADAPGVAVVVDAARRTASAAKPKRRRVGTMWDAEGYAHVLYAGDDLHKRGAVRWALY